MQGFAILLLITVYNLMTWFVNSNCGDTHWTNFVDKLGEGCAIRGLQPFLFRAWSYMEGDLEAESKTMKLVAGIW